MSIYIHGIDMPTKQVLAVINPDGLVEILNSDNILIEEFQATQVPPHGDLIDLKAPFKAQYYDEMTEEWLEKMVTVEDVLYSCMVDEMPPITIPAEEGET